MNEPLPVGVDLAGWITVRQAADHHQKTPETIRRWARTDLAGIRSRTVRGVRYVHAGDIDRAAARRPPGDIGGRAACAETGHAPTEPGRSWLSQHAAAAAADRSKTTIQRWAGAGVLDACWCACRSRHYVDGDQLAGAASRYAGRRSG